MLKEGKSSSTVGIYLRPLRAIFNKAIKMGYLPRDDYPFGRDGYTIPNSINIKKALGKEDLQKIKEVQLIPRSDREIYRDMWLFIYLCNGMNVADVCNLKYGDFNDNYFAFQRLKTIRTYKAKPKFIKVMVTPMVKRILSKWSQPKMSEHTYVFPFLSPEMSAEEKKKQSKQITHNINDNMDVIAKELGIERKVTTYVARHSFATILKNAGAPVSFISEAFGHSSAIVTENYLGSFRDDSKMEYAQTLERIFDP